MLLYLRTHFQSLASIAIRGGSVLAGFIIVYYLGHYYGPLANGQYALITQTGMFLSIVAVGGMDLAVVRHFSAAFAYKVPLARRALLRVLGYTLGAAALLVVVFVAGQGWFLDLLLGSHLPQYGALVLLAVLAGRATTRVMGAVMRSQGWHIVAQAIEVLFIPTIVCLFLFAGLADSLDGVLLATGGVTIVVAIIGILLSFRCTAGKKRDLTKASPNTPLDVSFRDLFRTSLPLWLTGISLNIADWYSLATAAVMLGVFDAGLFRVAFQVGSALTFCAMGIYNVFTAQISAAYATGDANRVARLSRSVTRLSVLVIFPVVVVLFVFAEELLTLISPEFRAAAPVLRMTVAGQLLYIASGPAGLVLAMAGHEWVNLLISGCVMLGLLVLAPLAAGLFGLYGLAALVACVPLAGNIGNLVAVFRLEKLNVITGRYVGR